MEDYLIGQNGQVIKKCIPVELNQYDILTHDVMFGQQVMVQKANHPFYELILVTNDKTEGIDSRLFNSNVDWYKLNYSPIGEYTPHITSVGEDKPIRPIHFYDDMDVIIVNTTHRFPFWAKVKILFGKPFRTTTKLCVNHPDAKLVGDTYVEGRLDPWFQSKGKPVTPRMK